jgi:Ca2+-transporting ATPase
MLAASTPTRELNKPAMNAIDLESIHGLSEVEAAESLKINGPNELPSSKPRSIWAIAAEVVREPMFLLLLAAGAICLTLGDLEEALLLLGFVFVVMGITLYQERKTERALEALRDLSSPRALVIREGKRTRIAGRDVVPRRHCCAPRRRSHSGRCSPSLFRESLGR